MKQDGLCLYILIYYTGHWAGIKQSPAQITKGQSKLFPWCLKGGSGNKTHSHPLTLSKWYMLDPETKSEVAVTDGGGKI